MPKVTIPGLKASTGQKSFDPLSTGRYKFQIVSVTIGPPKNGAPSDVWKFAMNVISGPEQADGKPAKGRKYWENVTIMQEQHPDYKEDQMGVDTLKSMCLAFGVAPKGDSLDPDAFIGLEGSADISQSLVKAVEDGMPDKIFNRAKWIQA